MNIVTAARTALLDETLHVTAVRRAQVIPGDDMTLAVRIVPWGESARVTDDGRNFYDESWSLGSLVAGDRMIAYDGHVPTPTGVRRGPAIGRLDDVTERPDGLWGDVHVANTARGRDLYELARTLGWIDVSLEADIPPAPPGTTSIARTADRPCQLTGLAIITPPDSGAYPGAGGIARSDPGDDDQDEEEEADEEEESDTDETQAGRARVIELVRTEMARYGGRAPARASHPLARFRSFDDFSTAVRAMPAEEAAPLQAAFADAYHTHTVARALADQVTADNPGLMPPSWLSTVFGIVDRGRPGIVALGGPRSPGETGLDVYWPYYDGDLSTIVGAQTAEKTEIVSVKVSFKRGQATLTTFAGGSDVSYQLQRRSSPSYRALYDRILQLAYGLTTENAFVDALTAAATAGGTWTVADGADGLRGTLFGESSAIRAATGAPASAVLAATDVYVQIGGLPGLVPSPYGTVNISGTATASTLVIDVSGLVITEAPQLAAGTLLVTNAEAAAWLEDGPYAVSAEDVAKLGTDVAIWGMGCAGVFLPAGVRKVTITQPVVGRSAR